jgi:hypothetical protein
MWYSLSLSIYDTMTRQKEREEQESWSPLLYTYFCKMLLQRPPLSSSGQSSWLQIQSPGFDSRRYHIFWEVVGLERGPLSLLRISEELLEWQVAAPV